MKVEGKQGADRGYTGDVPKGTLLALRVTLEVIDQLDAIVAAVPGLSRHAVARVALARGLEEMATDPRYGGKPAARRK